MPFQVTYTINYKDATHPTPEEFLATLNPNVVAAFPEATGKTLSEVLSNGNDSKKAQATNAVGFVSFNEAVSQDNLSKIITNVWENKAAYEAAFDVVCDEQPIVTTFPIDLEVGPSIPSTAYEYIRALYGNQYCASYVISFANI